MKKILLSAVVILSFIGYAWYVHLKGVTQTAIIAPTTIGKRIAVTPTETPITPTPTIQTSQPSDSEVQPTVTPQPATPTPTSAPQQASQYKDGSYTGSVADAFYGNLQVQVTVSGGKISNVQLVQSPSDRPESIQINQQAGPQLVQEAIQAQSATVDAVSGATQTSQAFVQSMQSALSQAKS